MGVVVIEAVVAVHAPILLCREHYLLNKASFGSCF
jgi:hypothetical protein